jgi:hypothetical protein
MTNKKISKELQHEIKQYLDYYWREESTHNVE